MPCRNRGSRDGTRTRRHKVMSERGTRDGAEQLRLSFSSFARIEKAGKQASTDQKRWPN